MKQDFLNYIQETFDFSPSEMTDFEHALSKPLKKTIRVNTNKISLAEFRDRSHVRPVSESWTLTPTPLWNNMFYIDREDTSLALGHTLEHISGYIYVQELAASSSPYFMSGDRVDTWDYTLLDMSASPGGKTTQLAEYYPNATIIANEIDKTRMRQLHENTDRLGAKNVFITNYDGRFFANYPEVFDKILLDAPCSGEWTAYKTADALKYWNIKNIRRIAKLQAQLLESALIALKVWWELVYSTCTLNRLENEEIIEHILKKYGSYVELQPLSPLGGKDSWLGVRAWPHITWTWGFFVAKLRKISSLPFQKGESEGVNKKKKKLQKHTQGFEKVSNTDEKVIIEFFKTSFNYDIKGKFYTYRDEIYYTEKNIDFIWENFFLYKCGIKIGKLQNWVFTPSYHAWVHFWKFTKNTLEIHEEDIQQLLRGESIIAPYPPIPTFPPKGERSELQDGYYQISRNTILAWLVKVKNWYMTTLLETKFMQK
jgi:16S rRNA (cytosine1407-C5)-methyltransferase